MIRWQKPVRLAVGAAGIAGAVVVYLNLGERPTPAPQAAVERIDPAAMAETTHGVLLQVKGAREDFEVRYATSVSYRDGSQRLTGVQITTAHDDGRRFVVTAKKATVEGEGRHVELTEDVRLQASDGFELVTDRGSFSRDEGILRAPERATFSKGRMSGSGRDMVYDKNADVLRINADADVTIRGDAGGLDTHVTAASAVLDRTRSILELARDVRVAGDQTMKADHALARLSAEDDRITFVELRGHATVKSAPAIDAMQAEAIDLDYGDESGALDSATLTGNARVVMLDGGAMRDFEGQRLDVAFGPDGSIARAAGESRVRMVLPASGETPARRIESARFHAVGNGRALSDLQFEERVVFREEREPGAARVARSHALAVALADDGAIRRAVFTGDVTFDDAMFDARAAEAQYDPHEGVLVLAGTGPRGEPSVQDERVVVDAASIRLALETERIEAEGNVKTSLLADSATDGATGDARRSPGLLAADQATRITAERLAYDGAAGQARYDGRVHLWQKETDLRADTMDIDLESGDLTARGKARAVLAFDAERSEGDAHEIAYQDGARRITYTAAEDAGSPPARLTGPQGDLQARVITVLLEADASRVERLEADRAVSALVDGRQVTGAHLIYRAGDDEYLVTGSATVPVLLRIDAPCRQMRGSTLIYSRATDRMQMDGSEVSRTQNTRGGSCQ